MPSWKILCDFDGTIALDDVTDRLLEHFARPGWEDIEAHWRAGRIGSRRCMAEQIALLDVARDELDALLDRLEIDPVFSAFVAATRAAGIPLEVVSDGVDYAIERILVRHGLVGLEIVSNALVPLDARSWRLDFPHANSACSADSGTCKCMRAQRRATQRAHVLIGDGRSDFCAAGAVDLVLAKGRLAAYCRERGLPHIEIGGFADALALLPQLEARFNATSAHTTPTGILSDA